MLRSSPRPLSRLADPPGESVPNDADWLASAGRRSELLCASLMLLAKSPLPIPLIEIGLADGSADVGPEEVPAEGVTTTGLAVAAAGATMGAGGTKRADSDRARSLLVDVLPLGPVGTTGVTAGATVVEALGADGGTTAVCERD